MTRLTEWPVTPPVPHGGRGCGKSRRKKMIYLAAGHFAGGVPLEENLIDPAIPYGKFRDGATGEPYLDALPVHRGARIVGRGDGSGINDVLITIGQTFGGQDAYRAFWDIFVEIKHFGASRAVPKTLNFEQLTPLHWDGDQLVGSRMLFLHRHVIPLNHYITDGIATPWNCVASKAGQTTGECDTKPLLTGWHPEGFAWGPPVNQPEPSPCTFALERLAYFSHVENDSDRLKIIGDDRFRVTLPSQVYYEAPIPLAPEIDELGFPSMLWGPGIALAVVITGVEFAKEADEVQKDRLENLGFQVSVLDY